MRYRIALTMAIMSFCISSHAFAYGEGWSDDIPVEARQIQLLINEARTDVANAVSTCPQSLCLEKACYTGSKAPYYWNDTLVKSAQLHSNMLKYRDEAQNKYGGIAHDSPCTLVSTIASNYPTCDGRADCACKDKKYTSSGTDFSVRVKYFMKLDNYQYSSWGETIAQTSSATNYTASKLTTGEIIMKDSPAYYYYLQLMTEGDQASGTKGACKNSNGNGHRFAIIGNDFNTVGCGVRCVTVNSKAVCAQTCDYGIVTNPSKNTLTAGSHYKEYSKLWFKTHYYANVGAKKVTLRLGDQCVDLEKTLGSGKNAVFGVADLPEPAECTPYFFESMDDNGNLNRFPTTGSLLFIPVKYSEQGFCNGKSWTKTANGSCICGETHHMYENACEENTTDNCGSHGNDCSQQIAGWNNGSCSNGTCLVTECQKGFHIFENTCEEDSLEHCGDHELSCTETVPGWLNGSCESGQCQVTECQEGYHKTNDTCEQDGLASCGPNAVDCTTMDGWQQGKCEEGKCILTECQPKYHLFENQCEYDTILNCGEHGLKCEDTVEKWNDGECENSQCVVTECRDDAVIQDNQCVDKSLEDDDSGDDQDPNKDKDPVQNGDKNPPDNSNENPPDNSNENPPDNGDAEYFDPTVHMESDFACSSNSRSKSHSLPIGVLMGLCGILLVRRRRAH